MFVDTLSWKLLNSVFSMGTGGHGTDLTISRGQQRTGRERSANAIVSIDPPQSKTLRKFHSFSPVPRFILSGALARQRNVAIRPKGAIQPSC